MTGAETLVALLKFASVAMPEIVESLGKLVAAFKSQHHALQGPPPVDSEAKVNAEVDERIELLEVDPPPTDPSP